jgi:hypothetical protein
MSCESTFGGGRDRRGRSQCYLPANTKTPPRFTQDGVHSVGAAYLCEEHGLCERPGRRLELKATPAPGRLVIV